MEHWCRLIKKGSFKNFVQLRELFPSADQVDDKTVFNIGGNKYRLIAALHYNRGKVYIRAILTHRKYDKGAEDVPEVDSFMEAALKETGEITITHFQLGRSKLAPWHDIQEDSHADCRHKYRMRDYQLTRFGMYPLCSLNL